MQNIAFISTVNSHAWGGSEELWSKAAAALQAQGHQVTACVKWWPQPVPQVTALQEAGCRIEWRKPIPLPGRMRRFAEKAIRRLAPQAKKQEKHWLDRVQPNFVVISQGDPYTCVPWAAQCRQREIPYALIAHAAAEHWWPGDADAAAAAECYEAAAASYFVSQGNLELVRTQIASPLTAAQVVRNPFGVDYNAAVAWPEEEDTLRLACVGRLEPSAKGQDILFAVLRAEKWKQRRLEVTLYGKGYSGATLKKLQERYGLHNVSFAGFTPDIREVWKTHHALVLPSRFEGLPITIVEAMLCGRPVIVTDVAGNAELVQDGVTGFVADAPTAKHLDAVLERAWSERSRLRQMGQLAGVHVRQQVPSDPAAAFSAELSRQINDAARITSHAAGPV